MNTIATTYTDQQLRILIEEFIAMQISKFSFNGVCSYILYRAMEEGRTAGTGLYESNQLQAVDCERVSDILKKTVHEGRITTTANSFNDETVFVKK